METINKYSREIQAYSAGYLEGVITKQQIYYHYYNTIEEYCKGHESYCQRLFNYLNKNLNWISNQIKLTSNDNLYWRQVFYLILKKLIKFEFILIF